MDGGDQTVNVSAFQKLYEACVEILALKLAKKHRKDPYSCMLWSELYYSYFMQFLVSRCWLDCLLLHFLLSLQSLLQFDVSSSTVL